MKAQNSQEKKRRNKLRVWIWFLLALLVNFSCILSAGWLALNLGPAQSVSAGMLAQNEANYGVDENPMQFAPLSEDILDEIKRDAQGLQATPDTFVDDGQTELIPFPSTRTPQPPTNTPAPAITPTAVSPTASPRPSVTPSPDTAVSPTPTTNTTSEPTSVSSNTPTPLNPTATWTPGSVTPTNTPYAPSATNTPYPSSATNTPVPPPPATNTPVPPPTNTPVFQATPLPTSESNG